MNCRAQPWLGTLVDVRIADPLSPASLAAAFDAAFSRIALVHRLMSFHAAESDVSRINRAAPDTSIAIDPHTARVLDAALMLQQASAWIFNIGCGTRLAQWDYLPLPAQTLPAYQSQDSGLLLGTNGTVRKTRDVLIDLGGIAKGYAVDVAIDALRAIGVQSACVNAGGDVRVLGSGTFAIAIRDPARVTGTGAEVALGDAALATSATYFSLRQTGSDQVSALVDGRNGAAITSAISASVLAPTCMIADALTKIVMATGDAQHPLLARFAARALIL
ncbi:FAD:protein FMN transferase [Actimicrobium antarcticum]|uniref:FAD:protein FMN transferase n=1 Tax=Actimicrobium antarcticum TaxID=1051899 RepID=A0ABP7TTV6_9BURK